MLCRPAKTGWKVIAKFTVSVTPDTAIDDPDESTPHWLLCSVPACAKMIGDPQLVIASSRSWMLLEPRLIQRLQALR